MPWTCGAMTSPIGCLLAPPQPNSTSKLILAASIKKWSSPAKSADLSCGHFGLLAGLGRDVLQQGQILQPVFNRPGMRKNHHAVLVEDVGGGKIQCDAAV